MFLTLRNVNAGNKLKSVFTLPVNKQNMREVSKGSFLCHSCFYFRVAGFTPLSPLPEVDNYINNIPVGIKEKFNHSNRMLKN